MVLEVRPPVKADKGTAVAALLARARVGRALYAGADTTDVDAFAALDGLELGLRVAVGSAEAPPALLSAADLVVDGTDGMLALLREL
jgi:trehalose 6-phosphate phosphatase